MKTIVISGAHSNTGKTTLARNLSNLLDNAQIVKIGTGKRDSDKDIDLFRPDDRFEEIAEKYKAYDYLIIESNSVLNRITPDLCIFLPGDKEEKESAECACKKADLIRGEKITCSDAHNLSAALGVPTQVFGKMLNITGVKLTACDFGVF